MKEELKNRVAIAPCREYRCKEIEKIVEEIAAACSLGELAGKRILVKPNILRDARPEKAITTHPDFLRAVIRVIQRRGGGSADGEILVGDSPGFQRSGFQAKLCGIKAAAEEEGARWVDFTRGRYEKIVSEGRSEEHFKLTGALEGVDLIINLPKLKTHQLMLFTGAAKNLFGLIPSLGKSPYHVKHPNPRDFAAMLADLLSVLPPVFSFMDGIIGMEGPGPGNGTPRHLGICLGGWNPGAVDLVAADFIGYKAETLPLSRELIERKMSPTPGEIELKTLGTLPARPQAFQRIRSGKRPSLFRDIILQKLAPALSQRIKPHPRFLHERCIRCGECIGICAAGALERSETGYEGAKWQVTIDPKACIRCYCCHEICPADAIEIG